MKITVILCYAMFLGACLSFLGGCASGKSSASRVEVSPFSCVLAPDTNGSVCVDVVFRVPSQYLSRRSRLIIVPQLLLDGKLSEELTPLVVDAPIYAKKMYRRKVVQNYQDPYDAYIGKAEGVSGGLELPYRETLTIPLGVHTGCVQAIVTEDGCGGCTGLDTVEVASVRNLASLIQDTFELVRMEPTFHEGKVEVLLQFLINRHEIRSDLGNNRSQLKKLAGSLRPILADTLTRVGDFRIYGMASADGSRAFNTTLARKRAESLREWLLKELDIHPELYTRMVVDSRPEGWLPVYQAMVDDGHPDSLFVGQILRRYPGSDDDVQEQYIRRLSCWKDICSRYLQKDRKIECAYTYTSYESVLATDGMRIPFPIKQMEANNQAILCLRRGQFEKAVDLLKDFVHYTPATMNTLAVGHFRKGDVKSAEKLLRKVKLPEAFCNLGVLMALQGKWYEAYRFLKGSGSLNEAVVALILSYNEEAEAIMAELSDQSPLAEYVRALVTSRLGDDVAFEVHLKNACQLDELRLRAAGEPDFEKYREDKIFREIVK